MLVDGARTVPAVVVVGDHLADVEAVHLVEQELHRVAELVGLDVDRVLEHVAGREFEPSLAGLALRVARLVADEAVELEHLLARFGDARRGVDHATRVRGLEGFPAHLLAPIFNRRSAFSRRNFGHTWSRNPTDGSSLKMRSRLRPMGKYPAYSTLSAPRVLAKYTTSSG